MADQQAFSPKLRESLRHTVVVRLPAAAAADATEKWPVFYTDRKITVHGAWFVPQSTVTGQNTNTFNLNLKNAGTGGAGTTELGNLDFVLGTNATGLDATAFAALDDERVSAGEVLFAERELVGTGLAMPEGAVVIEYSVD
jgi:hypothetical protein